MAPMPKPEGQRVRRNLGQKQWRTLERGAVLVPEMPSELDAGPEVLAAARVYWTAIWTDLGQMFIDADRYPLARLCVLHARLALGCDEKVEHSELRQLETAYGISPAARQRLMVQVAVPEPVLDGPPADVADMQAQRERRARIAAQR